MLYVARYKISRDASLLIVAQDSNDKVFDLVEKSKSEKCFDEFHNMFIMFTRFYCFRKEK